MSSASVNLSNESPASSAPPSRPPTPVVHTAGRCPPHHYLASLTPEQQARFRPNPDVPTVGEEVFAIRAQIIDRVVEIFDRPTIPLSPRSAQNILDTEYDNSVTNKVANTVARGLVCTLLRREKEYKNTELDLRKDLRAVEVRLEKYEGDNEPPAGYQRNNRDHPSLVVPFADGLFRPAYWIKQLDDGKVAMLDKEGDHSNPYVTNIYSAPRFDDAHPFQPIPSWFRQLLTGPSALFDQLRDAASELDDWGVLADIIRFREQDDEIALLNARLDKYQAELDAVKLVRSITQSRLEAAQIHLQLGHMEALNRGHPLHRPRNGWKKKSGAPDFAAERGLSG